MLVITTYENTIEEEVRKLLSDLVETVGELESTPNSEMGEEEEESSSRLIDFESGELKSSTRINFTEEPSTQQQQLSTSIVETSAIDMMMMMSPPEPASPQALPQLLPESVNASESSVSTVVAVVPQINPSIKPASFDEQLIQCMCVIILLEKFDGLFELVYIYIIFDVYLNI